MDATLRQYREFLKDSVRKTISFALTDQGRGVPPPPVQKPCAPKAKRIALAAPSRLKALCRMNLATAVKNRKSRRSYSADPLSAEELSFLLWATQGVKERRGDVATLRTVPSGGARHSFETYLYVRRVTGLEEGVYRYLPLEHELTPELAEKDFGPRLAEACFGQDFVARGAVTFIWSTIPYRMEWRYGLAAHRVILIDAGHVCQNLYLACEAIGAGTCAVGAYDQEMLDALLRLDGEDEFVIYLAPVGKKAE